MRVLVVALSSLLLVAGCAQQRIEEGLAAHAGQPAANLFAKLSYPDGRTVVDGRRAYIWGSEHASGSFLSPTASVSTVRQMTLTSTTMAMAPVDHRCLIRVMVDQNDRIVAWQSSGNEGGCAPYARRLASR